MTKRRRSPREQREERRAAIVAAARRVLSSGGYAAASIAAIAKEASISTGTVYLYFDDRDDLLAAVYRYASSHEVAAMTSAALGSSPAEQFQTAVFTFVDRALRGASLAYALIAEPAGPTVVAERNKARRVFASVFERIITAGVDDGSLACANPQVCADMVIGGINEAIIEAIDPNIDVEPAAALVQDIVETAYAMVRTEEDHPRESPMCITERPERPPPAMS